MWSSPLMWVISKMRDSTLSELSADLAALSAERDYSKPNSVSRSTLIGEVEGRDIPLVDDIIDTAGSVVSAVSELLERGARNITVACVHPVFSGPAWERLREPESPFRTSIRRLG